MGRLGVGLLLVGVVGVWLVALASALIFVSWAFSFAGLVLLARDVSFRRPARAGLVALVAVIILSVLGAGVTLGTKTMRLASTPALDPTAVLVSFGIVAAFWAAGVFVIVHEHARGERLGIIGAAAVGVGLVAFIWDALSRAGLAARPIVSGSGLQTLMVAGAIILFAAFARTSFRIFRTTRRAG